VSGKTVEGRPELSLIHHLWLYNHIQCETAGKSGLEKCPITGIILRLPMDEHQIIIQTSRLLEKFEPLRFRMKDSPGNCKVWMALINKVCTRLHNQLRRRKHFLRCALSTFLSTFFSQECAKHEKIAEKKSEGPAADSAESNPTLWKWAGKLDELTNRCADS
jgi:hypothetical protein